MKTKSGGKKRKNLVGKRVARTTIELVLTDIPGIGWLFIPLFGWLDYRMEKRKKKEPAQ